MTNMHTTFDDKWPTPGTKGAVLSVNQLYRYRLFRQISHNPSIVAFVMLNPSTADAKDDDPTIRRCMGFAETWYYGRLEVVNLVPTNDPPGSERSVRIARFSKLQIV